ncbi:uncharacterized protein isoform X1 [Rhodnius prolixus]|uniref:uncharacterized protein isoform X1 n=1 Tax=Rhodnius prolixus TaxID=13249 RepID=UPI003D18EA7F
MIGRKSKNILCYILIVTIIHCETLLQNDENYTANTKNNNSWLHNLKDILKKEDKFGDKAKVSTTLKLENWKNEPLKYLNQEDLMKCFLKNRFYNKNLYSQTTLDNTNEYNKFNLFKENKNQKAEKRKAAIKYDKILPTNEIDNKNVKDYDADEETPNKTSNLDNMFANIIKDVATTDSIDILKSNNDFEIIKHDKDEKINKHAHFRSHLKTKKKSINNNELPKNEPSVQILNLTQVFNMYAKLLPLKNDVETLHSIRQLISEIQKQKYYSDNENDTITSKYSSKHEYDDLKHQLAKIKDTLKNYCRNLTDIEQINHNNLTKSHVDNYSTQNLSKAFINRNDDLNSYLWALSNSLRTPSSYLNDLNKEKMPKEEKLNNENIQIVNAIKDTLFKPIENKDALEDLVNYNKIKGIYPMKLSISE